MVMSGRDKNDTVFVDFDGTISRADVVDAILEKFAGREWLRVEEEWRAGRIGSRECLRRQMALVRGTPAAIDALVDGIGIDEGFVALLDACASGGVPAHIVSDGFDYCIRRLLRLAAAGARGLVQAVQVRASHLQPADGGEWRTPVSFPEEPRLPRRAPCKPA